MNADLSSDELRVGTECGSTTERIAVLEQGGRVLRCVFHQDVINSYSPRLWGGIKKAKVGRGHMDLERADNATRMALHAALEPLTS